MSSPDEPRWGDPRSPSYDPRSPSYDPRSPEWRDPETKPWWGDRPEPPPVFPSSPMYAGPPPAPRRTRLLIALGIAAALILVVGASLAVSRRSPSPHLAVSPDPLASEFPNGGPIASDPPSLDPLPIDPVAPTPSPSPTTNSGDPVGTTKAYYGDLAQNRAGPAWNLLCEAREDAMPLADYKAAYAQDVATGTGIKSFTASGQAEVAGPAAAVPGTLVLADKESVPITVLLVMEGGGWRVCNSDLGGVLPNPGTGSDSGSGGVTT